MAAIPVQCDELPEELIPFTDDPQVKTDLLILRTMADARVEGLEEQREFCEKFLSCVAAYEQRARLIEQNAKRLIQEEARKIAALEWFHEQLFWQCVDAQLSDKNRGRKKPQKSLTFLHGKAGSRMSPGALDVHDAKAVAQWAIAHIASGIFLQPDKKALRDHIQKTGHSVPGCELIPGEDRRFVSTKVAAEKD